MDNLLSANYTDARVHGVLAPYDGLSRGIISSLRGVGYGTADQPWPIVTGQDAETPSVKAIIAGEQYSTVFKDTRELAKVTADLVDTVLSGGTPEGLDTTTYDNGVKVVPSLLLTPYEVDVNNYQELVIDSGYIDVKSGQQGKETVGTLRRDGAGAQARMDVILSANYSDGSRVHGVLAPYDGLSRGIISSLRGVGYGSGDLSWPIITGQDAEVPSVKAIIAGEQYSTIFKDTRELAQYTAQLIDTVLSGQEPAGLDTTTYDNGVKVVPSILLTPYEVDVTNYEERVIGSGYIKAEELQ
jgi:ABC-type xylose transport system substrate-binding protein